MATVEHRDLEGDHLHVPKAHALCGSTHTATEAANSVVRVNEAGTGFEAVPLSSVLAVADEDQEALPEGSVYYDAVNHRLMVKTNAGPMVIVVTPV